jgi:protein-S-isoprenylcysteine O-methyltransferase Ste14
VSSVLFRFRIFVFAGVVVLGFWAPWDAWLGLRSTRVWLEVPSQVARLGWMDLGAATLTLTILMVACAVVAAAVRVWGTAYLHGSVVYGLKMEADRIVADGPFRYVRNPLYVGMLFHVLALAVLMSPSGAIFTIVVVQTLFAVLVAGEERLLLARHGAQYAAYMKAVPRWVPALRARVARSGARARWGQAVFGELYPCGVALVFLVLAWRYNAVLLLRGALIVYGVRLVLLGMPREKAGSEKVRG